jgi:hypothetical protein
VHDVQIQSVRFLKISWIWSTGDGDSEQQQSTKVLDREQQLSSTSKEGLDIDINLLTDF